MVAESNASVAHVSSTAPALDIVIVNWNSQSYLRECLTSLDRSTLASRLNVIVVDNASGDGSSEGLVIKRAALTVAANAENVGFAAACNQGARSGHASLLLFLNPDVRVEPDALE